MKRFTDSWRPVAITKSSGGPSSWSATKSPTPGTPACAASSIGALDVAPTFRDDAVQASVGWPLVEMTLQSGSAPVVLTGILRPSDSGDRAWCRVHEFAEEFGISVAYEPLVLGERRGG